MTENTTLQAFEAFFAAHIDRIVKIHRLKPWERAQEDLQLAVKALNSVLRQFAKVKGRKDISVALVENKDRQAREKPCWGDPAKDTLDVCLDLVLALNGDTNLTLDAYGLHPEGRYPVSAHFPNAEKNVWLDTQEDMIKRIWSHFEDPQSDLVKLLSDKYWP